MQDIIREAHGRKESPARIAREAAQAFIAHDAAYLGHLEQYVDSRTVCNETLFQDQPLVKRFEDPEYIAKINDQQITYHTQYREFVLCTQRLAEAALAMPITAQAAEAARIVVDHANRTPFRVEPIAFRCTTIAPRRT